jgi:2-oxoglutarate dehydrogenase E2 component (dihydrolipoamide succinyltransferase)
MTVEVTVPQIGESISEVQIVQWLKREGQAVDKDEALVSIDSEKATIEIPAPAAGVVGKIVKGDGEFANVGEVIGTLEEAPVARIEPRPAAGQPAAAPTLGTIRPVETPQSAVQVDKPQGTTGGLPTRVSGDPDWQAASGTRTSPTAETPPGPAVAPTPTPAAAADAAVPRQEEIVPMSIIRRHIAQRLVDAQNQAALLTTYNEIDMSAVLELRKKYRDLFQQMYGIKLGLMSFFAKAAVEALKRFPAINAEIRGKSIVYRNYYDIGVAIGGGKGLVVPVLRDVQRMSFAEIERAIDAFARKAVENQLAPEDLEGGTFTISNGGIYGSLLSTPIVNPPQSGILGLHAIQERPVARNGQVVIRPMMYVALTYDHRLVDGREAVTFLRTIQEILQDPARMLLEV